MSEHDTRSAILATAAKLYAEKGYSAVSMRDVASEVGMTPANLYYHFKNKDELIQEVLIDEFSDKNHEMAEILSSTESMEIRINKFTGWFIKLLTGNPIFFRLVVRELLDGDENRTERLANSIFVQPFQLISSFARELSSKSDPVLMAVSITSIILGHVQLAGVLRHLPGAQNQHSDPDVIAAHVAELLHRMFVLNSTTQGDPAC